MEFFQINLLKVSESKKSQDQEVFLQVLLVVMF